MRFATSLLLLTGFLTFLSAQEKVQLKYSEPEFINMTNLLAAADDHRGTLQLLKKTGKKEYRIESYNTSDLTLTNTAVVNHSTRDQISSRFTPVNLVTLKNENYLILSAVDPGNMKQFIALQKIKQSGENSGKMQQIGSFSIIDNFEQFTIKAVTSENGNYLAIMSPVNTLDEERYTSEFILYSTEGQLIKYFSLDTDYETRWTNTGRMTVTDKGRIVIAISERKNNEWRPSSMSEVKLDLYISQADNTFKKVNVYSDIQEYSTFDYQLTPDQNNIECWGMYSDIDNKYGGDEANGLFNIIIDIESGVVTDDVKNPFSLDIIADLLDTRESKIDHTKGLPKQYKIIDVLYRGNERWLVFDNVIYKKYNTYDPRYGAYVHNDFFQFGSAIIIKTDKSCTVKNYIVIPKKQWSFNDNGVYSSMMVKEKGDRILLFFNDFIKNTKAEKIPEAEVVKMDDLLKSGFFMVEIQKDGSWTKTLVKNNLEDKKLIFPRSELSIEKNVQFGLFSEKAYSSKESGLNVGVYKISY
ncbi:hypothetical protein [Saccharicrinis sp. FJH54]|uniref:hypothetical protein n=1 Tax=Saccharicrinis sp. FJH54 TaxID=3344665 RepID=UPI0035D3F85A